MKEVKKENKYLLLKLEDIDNYFSEFQKGIFPTKDEQRIMDAIPFNTVLTGIQKQRLEKGKNPNPKYIVCNQDEPYAEEMWQVILEGERKKQNKVKHQPLDRKI